MKFIQHQAFLLLIILFTMGCRQITKDRSNYYFDSINGNDANTGTEPFNAFRSLSKIKKLDVQPGDSILLKSGAIFTEKLYFSGKGEFNKPIVIGKYGGDIKPHIKGDATHFEMVHIFNSEHIVVRDLEISNKGNASVPGLKGLLVQLREYRQAVNTTIDNLYIHDVYGGVEIEKGGGIALCIQNAIDRKSVV